MIKSDASGFLVGDLVDLTQKLVDGQTQGLSHLASIERKLDAMIGVGPAARNRAVPRPPPPTIAPVGRGGAANDPTATGSSSQGQDNLVRHAARAAVVAAWAATQASKTATKTLTPTKRDGKGRFVKKLASDEGEKSSGSNGGVISTAAENVKDAAANATQNLDPMINAAAEIKETLGPLGRGWRLAFGSMAERKKERWYKKIIKAIQTRLNQPVFGGETVAGGGRLTRALMFLPKVIGGLAKKVLSPVSRAASFVGEAAGGAGSFMMSMLARILPMVGAIIVPMLAAGGALLAGLGIGKLISDWMTSSGVSAKLFDAVDGMKAAWQSMLDKADNLWSDGKEKVKTAVEDAKQAVTAKADEAKQTAVKTKDAVKEKVSSAYDKTASAAGSMLEKFLPKGYRHKADFDGISGGKSLSRFGTYTDSEAAKIRELKKSGANTGAFGKGGMPQEIRDKIVAAAKAYGLDPDAMLKIAAMESGGNANAVSATGAIGIYQFVGKTASGVGINDRFNADQNIEGGMRLTRQNADFLRGNKVPVTTENLYMVHQLGPKAALEIIRGAGQGAAASSLSSETRQAMGLNYGRSSKTAKQYIEANASALGARYASVTKGLPAASMAAPVVPSSLPARIPPAPDTSITFPISGADNQPTIVVVKGEVGQNVSDRGIAHRANGGLGS
jgi:Transglycosylase SLT domain